MGVADVDVIVCTRDRPDDLARLLPTIRSLEGVAFRCIVVDQSRDKDRNRALVAGDDRFLYVPSDLVGKSRALNVALRLVEAPIVAFTDDDCVLPADWLCTAVDGLSTGADVLFGRVDAVEHDESTEFVPILELDRDEIVRMGVRVPTLMGMGANMAARREVFLASGGFDESMGPGACFRAGEDCEFAFRALAHGFAVRRLPRWLLVHHGVRRLDDGTARNLLDNSFFGMGVTYGKHMRAGHAWAAGLLMVHTARNIAEIARRLITRQNHLHVRRLLSFWRGVTVGLREGLTIPRV